MKSYWLMESPIGPLTLIEQDGALCAICFDGVAPADARLEKTALLAQAETELTAYFCGQRKFFSLPLRLNGTDFQRRCWNALLCVPYGETRSYSQQAEMAGSPHAVRAVGMANHRNPIPIIVPCHRIIGKNGQLTGYAGGISVKEWLLTLEKAHKE
ncbi:MAG: methylated-DNA--[protein]-cysteine S-methyltransferase [Clostridiales bacterium]|nr:methylated-DNA--[protein]-cysteine S-methyltransferase [Clostridiales bacterium]